MALKKMSSANLARFSVAPAGWEIVYYTFYARRTISASTPGSFPAETVLFGDVTGQAGISLLDTNMSKSSAIGNPKAFLAQRLNFDVFRETGVAVTNYEVANQEREMILRRTVTRIEVIDKEYLTVPTWQIPAGQGLSGALATGTAMATGGTIVSNGAPIKANCYPIELPLERETSFNVKLLNPAGGTVTTLSWVVMYLLSGLLLRPKQ